MISYSNPEKLRRAPHFEYFKTSFKLLQPVLKKDKENKDKDKENKYCPSLTFFVTIIVLCKTKNETDICCGNSGSKTTKIKCRRNLKKEWSLEKFSKIIYRGRITIMDPTVLMYEDLFFILINVTLHQRVRSFMEFIQ